MFRNVVLHDYVVSMGINTDVWIVGETVVHDAAEYSVSIGITGYTMDYMVRLLVIEPLPLINSGIRGFGGWQESEVADNLTVIFYYKATTFLHIRQDNSLRWIAVGPLVHISR